MRNTAPSVLQIGVIALAAAALLTSCETAPTPVAAPAGKPVDPADDILNIAARQELALGMVMEIHVAPDVIELLQVGMMQVRRDPRGDDVTPERGDGSAGDWIVVEALDRRGDLVSRTAVSDPLYEVEEQVGGRDVEDRTLFASLPTSRPVQSLRITSTALDKAVEVDVAEVMAELCAAHPNLGECKAR